MTVTSNVLYAHGESEAAPPLMYASTIYLNVCQPEFGVENGVDGMEDFSTSCGRVMRIVRESRHHSGGTNWSFLDGHVKWLTPEQLAELSCANPVYVDPFYPNSTKTYP